MAVKTKFSINQLENIVEEYDVGNIIRYAPISSGTVQTNYLLETTNAKLIFRYYENRSVNSVLFEVDLLCYLVASHYPCPAPYINKKGKFVGIYENKPYVLYQFMEGKHIAQPSDAQMNQLVKAVAKLNNLTNGYISPYVRYRMNYNTEFCKAEALSISQSLNCANADAKYKWYINQLGNLALPDTLAMGICHCDFHFTNVLYKGEVFHALIDFDDANYTYLTYDLVCLLDPFKPSFRWDTWSTFDKSDDVFDFTNARKILAEYEKYRPLSDIERVHLFDIFKFSIMIDCLWYFARGDVRDFYERRKLYYLDRLGRNGFCNMLLGSNNIL